MKRLFVPLLMITIVIVLAGCFGSTAKKDAKTTLNSSFTSDMKLNYDDTEYSGVISRQGPGMWSVEFSSPESLAGVKLAFMDSEVTASYKGLSFSIPKSAMPIKSILTYFISAADELAMKEKLEGSVKDGVMTVKGDLDEGSYEMMFDEATGNLTAFEMDNNKAKLTFTNMTASQQSPQDTESQAQSETQQPADGQDQQVTSEACETSQPQTTVVS